MRFSKLEIAILTVLEEAGEENLAALVNTTKDACLQQLTSCLDEFRTTLISLIEKDLLQIANLRDETSKRWIPLAKSDAILLLQQLEFLLNWSNTSGLWLWNSPGPRAEVLLTSIGVTTVRGLLTEGGAVS